MCFKNTKKLSEIEVFEPSVWTCIKKRKKVSYLWKLYQEKNVFQLQDGMETSSTSTSEAESIQNDILRDNSLITLSVQLTKGA